MDMIGNINIFENFLSKEECNLILNKCKEDLILSDAEVYGTNPETTHNKKIRNSSIGWISDLGFLNDKLKSQIENKNLRA